MNEMTVIMGFLNCCAFLYHRVDVVISCQKNRHLFSMFTLRTSPQFYLTTAAQLTKAVQSLLSHKCVNTDDLLLFGAVFPFNTLCMIRMHIVPPSDNDKD